MRAVLDTNVLISGLLWRGAPHECLLSAEGGLYELVLAESIFEELRDKLIHKFGNSSEEADEILENALAAISKMRTSDPVFPFTSPLDVAGAARQP